MKTIPEQLHEIYLNEPWHEHRMSFETSIQYHRSRYQNGDIHIYEENGEILGYYERYMIGNECHLYNVYVKENCRRGRVFKELYKHFFSTMPSNIEYITGEKQRLGGKVMREKIRR